MVERVRRVRDAANARAVPTWVPTSQLRPWGSSLQAKRVRKPHLVFAREKPRGGLGAAASPEKGLKVVSKILILLFEVVAENVCVDPYLT